MPGWSGKVSIIPGEKGFAYVPGQLLVEYSSEEERAANRETIGAMLGDTIEIGDLDLRSVLPSGFSLVTNFKGDVPSAIRLLQGAGLRAQPNHVFFAHAGPRWTANVVQSDPVYGHPVYGHPVYGHPVYGHPVYGHLADQGPSGGGTAGSASKLCSCGCAPYCSDTDPCLCTPTRGSASLVYPSPVIARSFYGEKEGLRYELTGVRPSNAIPLYPSGLSPLAGNPEWTANVVRIAVIDTGWPSNQEALNSEYGVNVKDAVEEPKVSANVPAIQPGDQADLPDTEPDDYLDPVAGHGVFIAGILRQYAPDASVKVLKALSSYGEGIESEIVTQINDLLLLPAEERPHILSLSFGTYAPDAPGCLGKAIAAAISTGVLVVASAGNDGTSRPQYPAAFPGVVSVAALGPDGPASFSNWGDWVRACAPGVDVASTFWTFDGKAADAGGADRDQFEGWALWSGTSFAAPIVAAALARELKPGANNAAETLARVIDHPRLFRMACYGTVINPPPGLASL